MRWQWSARWYKTRGMKYAREKCGNEGCCVSMEIEEYVTVSFEGWCWQAFGETIGSHVERRAGDELDGVVGNMFAKSVKTHIDMLGAASVLRMGVRRS